MLLEEREEALEAYGTRDKNFQGGKSCNISY